MFPGVGYERLLVIPTCQHAAMDLVAVGPAVEAEKDALLHSFTAFAVAAVAALEAGGHWADYIDPCSGLPMVHRSGSGVYGEVDALVTLRRFATVNAGCCKVALHPRWGSAVYPASIFTTAPPEAAVEALAAAAAQLRAPPPGATLAGYNVPQASSAAERNREPICEQLLRLLASVPPGAALLEVAAGAGAHAAYCAPRLPHLSWQPTDLLPEALPGIDAACAGAPTVSPARALDLSDVRSWAALRDQWPVTAVLAVNVTHISPWAATLGLLQLAAEALAAGGLLIVYGPFRCGGVCQPQSNAAFDASLRYACAARQLHSCPAV